MDLKFYDTLTREKRPFKPLDPNNVRMYVCGPTVYDFAHIGNARPVIVFDVLFRLLRHIYGADHVTYVRNITDVDDKINARAAKDYPGLPLNEAIRKITDATEAQFQADVNALGCLPPTHQPRATEFVLPRADARIDMKSLIQELLDGRNAYVAVGTEGKEVLFDVSSMPDYGALSGRKLEDQRAGARVAVDAHKKNPEDFVLWKESGNKEPGWNGKFEFVPNPRSGYEAEFSISSENASELGRNSRIITIHGRPGWHIECSAMSAAYLGSVFDIHGGGLDLIFPHHENEIAQSRCAFHTPVMANYWMHNGFLQVEGEKMSKSLGNFVTIYELLKDWFGQVLRFQMLSTHYRQPIDWTAKRSEELENELWEWATLLGTEPYALRMDAWDVAFGGLRPTPSVEIIEALSDDLNTPDAITALRASYKRAREGGNERLIQFMGDCEFLGLLRRSKLGIYSRTVVSTGLVAGYSLQDVRALRIAIANDLPDLRDKASRSLTAAGFSVQITDGGSVSLAPLTDATRATSKKIEDLIAARIAARKEKDFAESDRIRDELAKMGVVLKDTKDGTTWEIAR